MITHTLARLHKYVPEKLSTENDYIHRKTINWKWLYTHTYIYIYMYVCIHVCMYMDTNTNSFT